MNHEKKAEQKKSGVCVWGGGAGFLSFSHMLITGQRSTSHAIHFPLMRRDLTDLIFASASGNASLLKVITVHMIENMIIR